MFIVRPAGRLFVCGKDFNVGILSNAINTISVKLRMMVLFIELYPLIPLSLTFTALQGHSSVKQFLSEHFMFTFNILLSWVFLTHFSHCVGHLWVAPIVTWFTWWLNIDRNWNVKNPGHTVCEFETTIAQRHSGAVLNALTCKCFSIAVLTTQKSSLMLLHPIFISVKKQLYKLNC